MNGKLPVCIILALALTASPFALTQDRARQGSREKESRQDSRQEARRESKRELRQETRQESRQESRQDARRDTRQDARQWRVRQPRYVAPPYVAYPHSGDEGAGPNRQFRRGQRLAPEYRHYQYVVEDWHTHGLRQPPRGYHWVQSGSDYILVAIATGIILDILLNH